MAKPKLLLMNAFTLPTKSKFLHRVVEGPKESTLMNFEMVKPHLEDVEWEHSNGPLATYGDWPVETREEFAIVAAARLPMVREACESGKYDAIVLLGGGDPGGVAAREIGRQYNMPILSCGFSQMHVASMLGNRFSVIDMAEVHNTYYRDLIVQYGFERTCASIRNVNFPLQRPGSDGTRQFFNEREKAKRGEQSDMLDAAVAQSVDAIENDGAEVITFGCSAAFWMQPFLQKRLDDLGWEVPVLEGYSCAIQLAKLMIALKVDASGLTFPSDHPRKWRKRKFM
jgi:Asp/Glu/hydantoin racemase